MDWYRLHSRHFISHVGAQVQRNADAIERIRYSSKGDPQIRSLSEVALEFVGEEHWYTNIPEAQQVPPQHPAFYYNVPESERMPINRRKQNMFSRREKMKVGEPMPHTDVVPMQWSDYLGQSSQTYMPVPEPPMSLTLPTPRPQSQQMVYPASAPFMQRSPLDIGGSSSYIPQQTLLQPFQSSGFSGGLYGEQISSNTHFNPKYPRFGSPPVQMSTGLQFPPAFQ